MLAADLFALITGFELPTLKHAHSSLLGAAALCTLAGGLWERHMVVGRPSAPQAAALCPVPVAHGGDHHSRDWTAWCLWPGLSPALGLPCGSPTASCTCVSAPTAPCLPLQHMVTLTHVPARPSHRVLPVLFLLGRGLPAGGVGLLS